MEQRKTIGERLLQRLDRRVEGREPVGRSGFYEERYARYARNRGVSRLGLSLFPSVSDGDIGAGAPSVGDVGGPSYLDGAPYWARLRRLGNARLRRSQWLSGLGNRFGQRSIKALTRKWPGEASPQRPAWLSPLGFSVEDVNFLVPDGAAEPVDTQEAFQPEHTPKKSGWTGAEVSSSPWLTGRPFEPARVAKGASRKSRPLERIGSEQVAPQVVQKIVETIRTAAATASKTGVTQLVEEQVSSPGVARQIRRALKKIRRSGPMAPPEVEAALPDDFLPSTSYASQRGRRRSGGRLRGLSPVTASSPMMSALMPGGPADDSKAATGLSRIPALAAESGLVQRMAHREAASGGSASLSASPVRRPRAMGRTMRTGHVSEVLLSEPLTDGDVGASDVGVPVQPGATARMAQRLPAESHRSTPLAAGSSAQRSTVAATRLSQVARTPEGIYAPARTTLQTDVPQGMDAIAAPAETSSAHAARRALSAAASVDRNTVMPRAHQQDETGVSVAHTPAAARRASRVTRTPDGRYVPTPVVLSPVDADVQVDPADAAAAPTPDVQPSSLPSTRQTATGAVQAEKSPSSIGARYAADRLELAQEMDAEVAQTKRSLLPRVVPQRRVATDFVVPAHDGDSVQDPDVSTAAQVGAGVDGASAPTAAPDRRKAASAGTRAAARSHRTPLVGSTARRSVADAVGAESRVQSRRGRTARPSALGYAARKTVPSLETISILIPPVEGAPEESVTPAAIEQEFAAAPEQWVARQRPSVRGRPLDWSDARLELTSAPQAVASKPIHRPARVRTTAGGVYVPAGVATRGATAKATITNDDFTLPASESASAAETESQPEDATVRSNFDHTVQGVGAGAVDMAMPVWAQRSTGKPRITGADDLVSALTKASDTEEVMGVLMGQTANLSQVASSLPTPVVQVIQQIQTEAGRVADTTPQQVESTETVAGAKRGGPHQRGAARSTTRVVRGFTGLRPNRSGGPATSGMGKVTALAKRLQELIQLAENQNLSGARREVRMAEDSAAARSEGQGPVAEEGGEQDSSLDVNALTQEVTEAVQRELEMRRERRLEDPSGRSIWWE